MKTKLIILGIVCFSFLAIGLTKTTHIKIGSSFLVTSLLDSTIFERIDTIRQLEEDSLKKSLVDITLEDIKISTSLESISDITLKEEKEITKKEILKSLIFSKSIDSTSEYSCWIDKEKLKEVVSEKIKKIKSEDYPGIFIKDYLLDKDLNLIGVLDSFPNISYTDDIKNRFTYIIHLDRLPEEISCRSGVKSSLSIDVTDNSKNFEMNYQSKIKNFKPEIFLDKTLVILENLFYNYLQINSDIEKNLLSFKESLGVELEKEAKKENLLTTMYVVKKESETETSNKFLLSKTKKKYDFNISEDLIFEKEGYTFLSDYKKLLVRKNYSKKDFILSDEECTEEVYLEDTSKKILLSDNLLNLLNRNGLSIKEETIYGEFKDKNNIESFSIEKPFLSDIIGTDYLLRCKNSTFELYLNKKEPLLVFGPTISDDSISWMIKKGDNITNLVDIEN